MTAADHPPVTDDAGAGAGAEAERRYGAPDFATPNDRTVKYAAFIEGAEWAAGRTEDAEAVVATVFDNAPDEGWDSLTFAQHIVKALADAGRAETTTALPRPGDGCQCTWHNESRGGGYYETVAEYEPACPEHSEHVWNPRTGMWELRAETTTATTEAVVEVLNEHPDMTDRSAYDGCACGDDTGNEHIARALDAAGLLARPTPSRDDIADAIEHSDIAAQALEDAWHDLRVIEATGGHVTDPAAWLHERAAHIRGGVR